MLVTVGCAFALLSGSLYALRGGYSSANGVRVVGPDVRGMGFGAIALLIAAWYLGPKFALAIMLASLLHEAGHVAAYRAAGHAQARFRLVPVLGRHEISDRPLASEAEAFFVSIAGPALSLAPMVLAILLADMAGPSPLADALRAFALTAAVLNFVCLLPVEPLDGGRCLRAALASTDPRAAAIVALAASAMAAAAAVAFQSVLLFLVAAVGALAACSATPPGTLAPMTDRQAGLALGAYCFATVAHFAGGALVLAAVL